MKNKVETILNKYNPQGIDKEDLKGLSPAELKQLQDAIKDRQYKDFAINYVKTGNASASAVSVGFSKFYGNKLLANKKVRGYIKELSDLATTDDIASMEEAMLHLSDIMRGDGRDFGYTPQGEVFETPIHSKERLKALDIYTKVMGMQQHKIDIAGSLDLNNLVVDSERPEVVHEINIEDVEFVEED